MAPLKKPRKLSARQAAIETLALLHDNADPKRAESYQRYFKEPVALLGLDGKTSGKIKEDLLARVQDTWTLADAVRFCKAMVRDPSLEARGTGFQVVARFVSGAPPELLNDIKTWLERSCGNWGLVDNLAPSVLAPFLQEHEELIPEVVSWIKSPTHWIRRGAVVAFVPLVRSKKKKHLATAYRIATRLLGDQEDLMHKAVGWLLRETGKADMKRLEKFLLDKGPRVPRTTLRYAIERFPATDRKRILTATRGDKPRSRRK